MLSIAGQLIVLWTCPLSLFPLDHGKITLTLVLIGLLLLSSYIYWSVAASCYSEGSNNFPGPVSCHHTLLFIRRNTCTGTWEPKSLTSSSSHKTGLGCCCSCLVLCCSSSHILLHLQQGNKNEVFKQAKPFSPLPECNRQGLLEHTAIQPLSALAWGVAGAAQGDLGAWQKPFKGL